MGEEAFASFLDAEDRAYRPGGAARLITYAPDKKMDFSFLPHKVQIFDRSYIASFGALFPAEARADFQADLARLLRADLDHISDAQSQGHLICTLAALAAYRCLLAQGAPREDALARVTEALIKPGARFIKWATWIGTRLARDKIGFVHAQAEQKAARHYGDQFEMSCMRQGQSCVQIVRRCAYVETLRRHGADELAACFCVWDRLWIEALPAEIRFSRPCTLAEGGACCRFEFTLA